MFVLSTSVVRKGSTESAESPIWIFKCLRGVGDVRHHHREPVLVYPRNDSVLANHGGCAIGLTFFSLLYVCASLCLASILYLVRALSHKLPPPAHRHLCVERLIFVSFLYGYGSR